MRSYLSLIPISAKLRKRQNHMTLLCIVFAVFLVTGIFSMADMLLRAETAHAVQKNGNWHIKLKNITEETATELASRSDVAAASWYDSVNLDMDKDYTIGGMPAALSGTQTAFRTDIMHYFPDDAHLCPDEIILTPNARTLFDVTIGDSITLDTPAGSYIFRITGFRSDNSLYATSSGVGESTALPVKENQQVGAFLDIASFQNILHDNQDTGNPFYYIQFHEKANIRKALTEIKERDHIADADIDENFILMVAKGLSSNPSAQNLYPVVAVLFLLILLAGVLMISGSLNSTIAQRTQFFGMMRCIGMSKQQVVRFVRLEALNWCKTAIPIGILLGISATWILCAMMRYFVRGEFADMPVFGISMVGILCGTAVGILTVLIAAQSPAKRAAKVSPVAAVSGNDSAVKSAHRPTRARFFHIETALGISHACTSKKNLFLLAGSFSLSIILFLNFSILVELLGYLLPTKSYVADICISMIDGGAFMNHDLLAQIRGASGVKRAFGRMHTAEIPAEFSTPESVDTVDLISYDDFQLDCLEKDDDLREGSDLSKVYGDQDYILAVWDKDIALSTGDTVTINSNTVNVAGMIRYSPFSNNGRTNGEIILICSEQTYTRLTGQQDFSIIDIQLNRDATEADIEALHDLVRGKYEFVDRREEGDRSTFWAFSLFIYGFLVIIALITILNIVNSISMSVSARMKQYGAMRAVGMDGKQLTKMITMEAVTYAVIGCIIGCAIGLPLNKLIYDTLITAHFPYFAWHLPISSILIIIGFIAAATATAVYKPSKRLRNIAVTDTINEL